ncbi:hypothetical protein Tsubulata_035101 [Turnera subulata]|uniref:Protein kinase domain-containing protein n=1 Tax=Turnera subulata TaxID=218843 RepID=A0A9Q0FCU8_9ROSI|nr:hypothetical protein Tsubulata_035101 [Turnera subulata]
MVLNVEAVLEFLHKNGLKEAELALTEDMVERNTSNSNGVTNNDRLGSFDFEKFLFVLPPVRIPASSRQQTEADGGGGGQESGSSSRRRSSSSSSSSSLDEFVSLGSSTSASSETSSCRMSQFGTARDHDFDMQNDLYWYNENDEGCFMTPSFKEPDYFGCPSEDKFVMTSESERQVENPLCLYDKSDGFETEGSIDFLDKPCLFNVIRANNKVEVQEFDRFHFDNECELGGDGCSAPSCKCCTGAEGNYGAEPVDYIQSCSKATGLSDFQLELAKFSADCYSAPANGGNKNADNTYRSGLRDDLTGSFTNETILNETDDYAIGADDEVNGEPNEHKTEADEENVEADELLMYDTKEDDYEVFDLRIIHRKNRTGFEENKDFPILINTVIAGRYYVTEYLGSAAFSKVIQAQDLQTGLDVCLKIIKNDKDFFDQSLDEIKLLKFVNKHDPADEHHILRLYDYFYHQEHLFIVCELLRANLYEFQKFNQESGGEPYFTPSRLQVITRQCLEALDFLHHLGIIHCDLKPENILIKSYRRSEIKVIDLGSSCFQSDNLCLYVQSRSYRAPEVILGLPYDQKIDLWSLGCILAELCSGEVLFPNDAVVMILARMIGMLGPIDLEMLEKGQEAHKYFTKEYDLYLINEETDQLEYIIPEESSLENHLPISDVGFIDFVRSLLELNPLRRPSAREALQHPWLSHPY